MLTRHHDKGFCLNLESNADNKKKYSYVNKRKRILTNGNSMAASLLFHQIPLKGDFKIELGIKDIYNEY
jgi:hypothetical protein